MLGFEIYLEIGTCILEIVWFMFSIIIPCQKFNPYLQECLEYILKQDYTNFEIIVLPDVFSGFPIGSGMTKEKIKIIPTGPIRPGAKRNIGAREAQGEILVFIDDDAYPAKDWLKNASRVFEDKNVIALGGPGLTPPNDSFWQQVSGAMYLSWFSGANPKRFWPLGQRHAVDDWPSMNFFVRRDDFLAIGGFAENFWPGEDTKLCLDLIHFHNPFRGVSDDRPKGRLKKQIIYNPSVIVYHHRRKSLAKHLKQAGQFGWHRGYFAKKFPKNSLRFKYFLPSLFLLFVLFGWLLLVLPQPFNLIYPALWILYFSALLISLIQIYAKIKKIKVALATLIYIPATHLWYGVNFLKGMFLKP